VQIRAFYFAQLVRPLKRKEIEFLTNPSGRTNLANVDAITQAAATLGRLGGFAKSRKKRAAAKKNGKKGGRP
jgi:hypothetical protein